MPVSKMSELDASRDSGNPAQHWHVIPHDKDYGEWIHRDLDGAMSTVRKTVERGARRVEIDPCTSEECLALDRAIEASDAG